MIRKSAAFLAALTLAVAAAVGLAAQPAALKDPAKLKEQAPAKYNVKFDTSVGVFVVTVTREWAPLGADRFYNLVKNGYYDGIRFFRAVPNFMVQFGIHGDPALNTAWRAARIGVDPVKQSKQRGYITYAMGGSPDTRTTHVFINYGDNSFLDKTGFAPFGQVSTGMEVVDKIFQGYGDGPPRGKGPDQTRLQTEGNPYLEKEFPKMDYIKKATIEP